MPSPTDDAAPDTAQFPLTRDDSPPPGEGKPAHAVTTGTDAEGISRAGWWAITLSAAALLLIGLLLTFGPARYWTPVPVVFLGYFLISGLIGLAFWKGVRELRDSNPTLHSGDGPASPGQRVAAAIGAVGVASALILLPMGLNTAPANAAPCPDGSQTCGPGPTQDPGPTQGNGGNTTAPQAPNTTVPGYTPPDTLAPPNGNGNGNTFQGTARPMPTPDQVDPNACIANCGPTQAPQQAPQTGQATPPQTGQPQTGQNPVTTAPNTAATTPQAPTTTPKLRTPTPETTTSTTSDKARDRDQQGRDKNEDRDKNSGIPYQAAWLAGVGGTYRRKKLTETAVRDGKAVAERATEQLTRTVDYVGTTVVDKPTQALLHDEPIAIVESDTDLIYGNNPPPEGAAADAARNKPIPAQPINVKDIDYTGMNTWKSGPDAVKGYINQALDAMNITDPKARSNWSRGMLVLVQRESSYNAPGETTQVNTWDENSKPPKTTGIAADGYGNGDSRGAAQCIPATFAQYHQPGTSNKIYDPVANIAADMNHLMDAWHVARDGSNLASNVDQANPNAIPHGQ